MGAEQALEIMGVQACRRTGVQENKRTSEQADRRMGSKDYPDGSAAG
ncbi:hypothetical protein [Paenibacillus borealis]|nr:hypothetical protein [Paenibacillus borealis]